jgi:membrane associated rhomboid family serine protease
MQYARHRSTGYASYFPPGVKWLLIINTGLFVLRFVMMRDDLARIFGLIPREVLRGAIWQPVTYMFLHDAEGFFHILFNMLALWMFGPDLERDWGTRRFLKYYFLCGVGAAVCVVAAAVVFGGLNTLTIGASGAILGVLLAYGLMYPNRPVLFFFLFPIAAKYLVMIIGAITFLSAYRAGQQELGQQAFRGDRVSHMAHLGGMLFGYVYLKTRFVRFNLLGGLRRQYQTWKMQRTKKRFQVYLRKHKLDRDRWVN